MSRPRMSPTLFWKRVEKSAGCWKWLGGLSTSGYGQVSVDDKPQRAHRYAYTIAKGPIPRGVFVLHMCDNRACVKPQHLFLGSHQDNMDDMKKKNRHKPYVRRGETHRDSKLQTKDVVEIRKRRVGGESLSDIAKDFPVDWTYISRICLRKRWAHVK